MRRRQMRRHARSDERIPRQGERTYGGGATSGERYAIFPAARDGGRYRRVEMAWR